jgi:hypothetical protein
VPRWVIGYLRSRRLKAFLSEFPNALDVMVRSIKSGLPLNDAIRMISAEGQEPVRTEFKRIVEAQQMGMNVPEACARLYNRIPLSEANFFAIVIAIQAQAGGNLVRSAGQPVPGLARPKEDESEDQCNVDGSKGFSGDHWCAAFHCGRAGLSHVSRLHHDPVHRLAVTSFSVLRRSGCRSAFW